jgi:AbrB family looped-hinge helix DNA binding protein
MGLGITKISRSGQIVIPAEIRETMGIEPADRFLVISEGEDIVLRKLNKKSRKEELFELLESIREDVRKRGITREDLEEAIREVRRAKRKAE